MKLATVGLLSFAQSIVLGSPSPSSYPVRRDVDLQWTVQAFPNGPFIHVNGTIEQVYDHVLKINPSFDKEFVPGHLPDEDPWSPPLQAPFWDEVNFEGKRTECGEPLRYAPRRHIRTGIEYLRRLPFEVPELAPGTCGRVSCAWDSAIKWCNNIQRVQRLKSMKTLADGAEHLAQMCVRPGLNTLVKDASALDRVSGQVWHEGGWSIIVGLENC